MTLRWAAACALPAAFVLAGCASASLSAPQRASVDGALTTLRADAFSDLKQQDIDVGTFSHDDVFFQSNFDVLAALLGERRYHIEVNPAVFAHSEDRARALPDDALRGVLAHELSHTVDYVARDRAGLLALLPILWSDDANRRFERNTDIQTVARGLGPELLVYRQWQRRVLSAEAWKRKRAIYYGPDELRALIDVRGRCPHVFYRFISDPPMGLRDIEGHCP